MMSIFSGGGSECARKPQEVLLIDGSNILEKFHVRYISHFEARLA